MGRILALLTALVLPLSAQGVCAGEISAWGNDSDGQVSAAPTGTGFTAIAAGEYHGYALRGQVPWHLDRIDQATLPLDGAYAPPYCSTGTPTTVYIVGAGIDTTLPEFGNRASVGWGSMTDLDGYSTGIASLVGGSIHGVDTTAKLVSVQVIDGSGPGSPQDVVDGLQWIRSNNQLVGGNAVVCYALGGGYDSGIENEIDLLIEAGLTVVVPAGDGDADACSFFPAWMPETITVGATDQFDAGASFSNCGSCLDLFVPGVDIESSSGVYSSTRFSAAIAAGAASLWLRVNGPATPAAVKAGLRADATPGAVIGSLFGSPNLLLRVDDGELIRNGSFENGTCIVSTYIFLLTPGPSCLADWNVSNSPGGGVELIRSYWEASEGEYSVELAGGNQAGGVEQLLSPTVVGHQYRVSFDLAGQPTPTLPDTLKSMRVEVDNGQGADFSFDTAGHTATSVGWQNKEWFFTATSTTTTIRFLATNVTNAFNAAIDNVSVVPDCSDTCDDTWCDEGFALAGVHGDPLFVGSGDLTAGSSNPLELSNAAALARALLFWNLESAPVGFKGGTAVPGVDYSLYPFMTSAAGEISVNLSVPSSGIPVGTEIWLQWAIQDGAAVHNYAMSNAIKGVSP